MNTEGYTKLASSILTSTIWVESDQTLRVWITILALCDRSGFVSGTVPGLANVAKVHVDACREAITKFLSPDQDSRTKDHEGRRIQEVDGGWLVLNHRKYRNDRDPDSRREQTRRAVAKYRETHNVSHGKPDVSHGKPQKAQSESESESESIVPKSTDTPEVGVQGEGGHALGLKPHVCARFQRPTAEEIEVHAAKIGLPMSEATRFISYYESNGWKVGKNHMKSWTHAMVGWKIRWEEHRAAKPSKPKSLAEKEWDGLCRPVEIPKY